MLLWNGPSIECSVTFGREGVSVERNERIPGVVPFEGVVQSEQCREVSCVRDESCPYWILLVLASDKGPLSLSYLASARQPALVPDSLRRR